ncbi:UTP--glucose-1-phosphate uridylyltransferase [Salana multivorans]
MGAAVNVFPGAKVIEVERARFLPVKTTNDLLLLRSDVYDLTPQWHLVARRPAPLVSLGDRFTLIGDFETRIEHVPSLLEADSLTVSGDWRFGDQVRVVGDGRLVAGDNEPHIVPPGSTVTADGVRADGRELSAVAALSPAGRPGPPPGVAGPRCPLSAGRARSAERPRAPPRGGAGSSRRPRARAARARVRRRGAAPRARTARCRSGRRRPRGSRRCRRSCRAHPWR